MTENNTPVFRFDRRGMKTQTSAVQDFKYCTMLGSLIISDHQLYRITPLKAPFGLLIPLLQSSPTRNYIHSQLFITLCHIYTAYNHTRL
jgi:hypothetical protein